MSVTQTTGVEIGWTCWWQRLRARLRPTPSRPPSYHASRTANVRPGTGGRHRCATGVLRQEQLPSGWIVTFRRRP
jgi:hypothetical protein